MTKRIFRCICLVALAVFFASLALLMDTLYRYFSTVQRQQLRAQTALAAQGVAHEGAAFFEGLHTSGYRLTWISADGAVLYDSQADPAAMSSHADRAEVAAALAEGYGESERYSETLLERQLYTAQRLPDGSVLRLASTQSTVVRLLLGLLQPIAAVAFVAVLLSLWLASRLSRRIVRPLNELDLDHPLESGGYDELSPLLRRIDSQHRQIQQQLGELRRRQEEFSAITASMNEGLVLLNERGVILGLNKSAARLLGTDEDSVGRDMLAVDRSPVMLELLQAAQSGQRAERVVELASRQYELDASPIFTDGALSGTALLFFDVTERVHAEALRREFTANISHELKTPLHSIYGCSELLCSDLVRPEDVGQFARQIHAEAQRMIRLVDDILRLSELDEGAGDLKREPVDLFSLAQEAVQGLAPLAQEAGVTLALTGTPCVVHGVPRLLSGVIVNLCDNAIKYNRPGGSVTVDVRTEGTEAVLSVADTGIGIAPEHQSRVFERFYRVDKSHSKQIGGTGLGLSIVKHAARVHDGRLALQSRPGEGTTVTLRLPG